jgi:hypothetical protein
MPPRTADGGRRRIRERGGLRTNSRARRSQGACSRDLWAGCRSTPARCHSGIWAGMSGSLIGSPGHLAGTWTCSVGQPVAWRTIDSCALPSMTSSGAASQCWQANTSSATLTPTHWAYFGHEIRFVGLFTMSDPRKRWCAVLGLNQLSIELLWRIRSVALRGAQQ